MGATGLLKLHSTALLEEVTVILGYLEHKLTVYNIKIHYFWKSSTPAFSKLGGLVLQPSFHHHCSMYIHVSM